MSACPEGAVLSPEILAHLDSIGADMPEDPTGPWQCDFDPGHAGDHWTYAKHCYSEPGRTGDLWLRWPTSGPAVLIDHPPCESTPSGDEDNEEYEPVCYLPADHPGQHDDGEIRW
jgi:hypothetical protein